jgi:hypothetical protein
MDEFKKKIYNEIAKNDSKPIGNIILNLCGCRFCEAFGIDTNCGNKKSCTDYIDDFVKSIYAK